MKHLIDVRSIAEYQTGHAQNSINIPVDQLAIKLSQGCNMDKTDEVVVYCLSGARAGVAKTLLERAGFQNVTNAGGLKDVA